MLTAIGFSVRMIPYIIVVLNNIIPVDFQFGTGRNAFDDDLDVVKVTKFDEQFDDLNEEIADMFYQEEKDVYRQRRRDIGADKKSSHCL